MRTCGTGPAILAGIVSSVALYQVWDHPAAAVAYALNIAFGAWVFARRPTIPQLAEAAYWPVVGGPLMWGVYRYGPGTDPADPVLAILAMALNMIVAASLASAALAALLMALPAALRQRIVEPGGNMSIRAYITVIVILFTSLPLIALIVHHEREDIRQAEADATRRAVAAALEFDTQAGRLADRQVIALAAALGTGRLEGLPVYDGGVAHVLSAPSRAQFRWLPSAPAPDSGLVALAVMDRRHVLQGFFGFDMVEVWIDRDEFQGEVVAIMRRIEERDRVTFGAKSAFHGVSARASSALPISSEPPDWSRWEDRAAVRTVALPGSRALGTVTASYADRLDAMRHDLRQTLAVATLTIFSTPLLVLLLINGLHRRMAGIRKRMERVVEGSVLPTELRRERTLFREAAALEGGVLAYSAALGRERAARDRYRQRLEAAMSASSTIFFTLPLARDRQGHLRFGRPSFVSASIVEVLGYSLGEALEEGWFERAVHPEDLQRLRTGATERAEALLAERRLREEIRLRDASGEWRTMSQEQFVTEPAPAAAGAEEPSGPTEVIGVLTDVTQRRQAEAQVLQAARMADLGVMASGIAHELNQPLSIIRLAAVNAAERVREGGADEGYVADRLDMIVGQVSRAARITDHMRLFGDTDDQPLENVDIAGLLAEMGDLLRSQLRRKGIVLEMETPGRCPAVVARPGPLEQSLLNVILNSARRIAHSRSDARPPEMPAGRIRLAVRIDSGGGTVRVECTDDGGEIDPAAIDRIFEPFATTGFAGEEAPLGLAVAYSVIRGMGGRLSVSNCDGGAMFTIELPEADAAAPQPRQAPETARAG